MMHYIFTNNEVYTYGKLTRAEIRDYESKYGKLVTFWRES